MPVKFSGIGDGLEGCSTGDFAIEDDSTINLHISIVELASCQSNFVELGTGWKAVPQEILLQKMTLLLIFTYSLWNWHLASQILWNWGQAGRLFHRRFCYRDSTINLHISIVVQELVSPQLRPVFRKTDVQQQERAKLIDLGLELAGHAVVLIITVLEVNEQTASIRAQVYPTGEVLTLPPNLKLSVLTETGEVFKEVTARSDDEFIQYQFEAQRGDYFGIQVALGEVSLKEKFRV